MAATATPSPGQSGRLPGSVVKVTVNGKPYVDGAGFTLVPTGSPVTIVMAFPFAVDRSSVERWLSKPPIAWIDDRTAQVTFAETEPIGFKIAETRAATGDAVIDWFTVNVDFPATRVVNIFATGEVYGIATGGSRTAADSHRISAAGALTVSPDGTRAIHLAEILASTASTASTDGSVEIIAEGHWKQFTHTLEESKPR